MREEHLQKRKLTWESVKFEEHVLDLLLRLENFKHEDKDFGTSEISEWWAGVTSNAVTNKPYYICFFFSSQQEVFYSSRPTPTITQN